jgi:hypothetical protein
MKKHWPKYLFRIVFGFGMFLLLDSDTTKTTQRRIFSALLGSLVWTAGVSIFEWFIEQRRSQKQNVK